MARERLNPSMAVVTLSDLSVVLAQREILDRVSLDVPDGAFAAVLGPSGCGKSTLLRTVAGLTDPTSGSVSFDGQDVTAVAPSERDIGMVFQTPALLPRRSVRRNVQFPLELRRETADAIRDRVTAEARALHIEHLLSRSPSGLSRGEEQLVQIARAMVRMPRVLLLDEPFSPLDEQLRARMRSEIGLLQRGYGVTTIMATNDPIDAMSLASMLIVLNGSPAHVVQVGTPTELHSEPATIDVARSTGSLWTLEARVERDGGGYWLRVGGALRLRSWAPALSGHVGATVTVGVRTEHLVRDERGGATMLLRRVIPGAGDLLLCSWGGRAVTATGAAAAPEIGTTVRFRLDRPLVFSPDGRRLV